MGIASTARSYSKSGDREHKGNTEAKTLAPTARGSRAQLAPTARGAWGITELNTETSYSLWYRIGIFGICRICGLVERGMNRITTNGRVKVIKRA